MLQGHEVVLNLWWKNLCVFHSRWVVGGENGVFPSVLPVTNIARMCITNKSVWEWGARKNGGRLQVPTCFLCCCLSWFRKCFGNFSYYGAGSFRWVRLNWDETCFEKRVQRGKSFCYCCCCFLQQPFKNKTTVHIHTARK